MGLPGLSPANRQRILTHNRLLAVSLRLMDLAAKRGIQVVLENPHSSRLWRAPSLCKLAQQWAYAYHRLDMCQYGTAFRKMTGLFPMNIAALKVRCCKPCARSADGATLCSRTNLPHEELAGFDSSGIFKTRSAQIYPTSLCRSVCRQLAKQ